MDLLQWQLSDGVVNGIDKELGVNNPQKTNMAANAALSVLMSALNKNSQSSDALSGLMGALDRDHDGGILDDLLGTLSGRVLPQNQKTINGAGILGHLLGGKQSTAVEAVTKMTGLDSNQSMNILSKLAPLVLGVLGRVKKQKQLDNSKMRDFLRESQEQYEQQNTSANLFSKLLDKDGDGNVMDEIAGMGMKMIGNWLRR